MIITTEERNELFRAIYKLQEGDELVAASKTLHPSSDEAMRIKKALYDRGNRLGDEAWKTIMKMTDFQEGADMP